MLVVIIGCLLLLFYISHRLNQIREPVLSFLKSQIQGEIQIGEIKASLLPAGLRLKNVKLFALGDREPSATIEEMHLRFELFQFFQKEIDARIYIRKPTLRITSPLNGKNNFEEIFVPLISDSNEINISSKKTVWWNRLKVTRIRIYDASFITEEKRNFSPEIESLEISADQIDFDSVQNLSPVKISFHLPRLNRQLIELNFNLRKDPVEKNLQIENGSISWGSAKMKLSGSVLLPNPQRKSVELALEFALLNSDLKKFLNDLKIIIPFAGDLSLRGKIFGSIFDPVIQFIFDSKKLYLSGKEINHLHAEVRKKEKTIEIEKANFGIYGGEVQATGTLIPEKNISGNFNVSFHDLYLSAISGKPHPGRLRGNLKLNSNDILIPNSFSGTGNVSVGPIPLPNLNLKEKIGGAQLLTGGFLFPQLVNLNPLSNSANLIGSQIDSLNSQVSIHGEKISLNPFRFSNSKVSGSGSGEMHSQKTIDASGVATLSSAVTTLLFPDRKFRSSVTGGKGALSIPFRLSGSLENPQFTIEENYLKNLVAKIVGASVQNMIFGDKNHNGLLNPLLKGTPFENIPLPSKSDQKKPISPPEIFKQLFFGN